MNSTALGATVEKEGNIIFICDAHEKFYYEKLKEVKPLNLDKSKLAKLNKLRVKAEMPPITIL